MKTKSPVWIPLILLVAVLCAACQGSVPAAAPASASTSPEIPSTSNPSLTPPPTLTARPTATAMAVAATAELPALDQARDLQIAQAVQDYFSAVSDGKPEAAADRLSSFSLMVFQMTRGDAAEALQSQRIQGLRWSDLKILDTQPFDAQTVLVHVSYTEKGQPAPTPTAAPRTTLQPTPTPAKTAQASTIEALWPMRLEQGEWRYNWKNLIDFRTLDAEAQTMNGITILPVQLNRYSDRIEVSMLVQNRTNEAVVFGQVNETLGTFRFGDRAVTAEKTRWILNPLRSVPTATLEIKGLFTQWPDTLEIRQWNSYNVKPWYVFQLQ